MQCVVKTMLRERIDIPVEMTSDARQQRGNLGYAITYNVIRANQKTEPFAYHWF